MPSAGFHHEAHGRLPMEAYTEDDDWPEALEDCDARLLFSTAALLPRVECSAANSRLNRWSCARV